MARSKLYDLIDPNGKVIYKTVEASVIAEYLGVDRAKVVRWATANGCCNKHKIIISGLVEPKTEFGKFGKARQSDWKQEWDEARLAARKRMGWKG